MAAELATDVLPRSLGQRLLVLARTSTFQLTLFYTFLFMLSSALLSLFLYWSTVGVLLRETDATLKAEITGLAEQYIEHGLDRLVQVIVHRIRSDQSGEMLYLFATRDNQPLAGNLLEWPHLESEGEGWVEFDHRRSDGREVPARARVYLLRDGLHLLVGREIGHLHQLQQTFNRALLLGVGLVLVLATAGGMLMSSRVLQRVGAFTAATDDIMAGQLNRRLEIRGSGDEFDALALRVNHMLDRLEALVAAVRHVADNIAHDLRTPLTRLRNRIELTAQTAPADLRAELATAVVDADALLTTFAALLRIARIESGSYGAEFAAVDLSALAADAHELYLGIAQDRRLAFTLDAAGGLQVHGDRNLLFQALTNLLDNAIKYTPADGSVSVSMQRRAAAVEIDVRDSGPGIAAADHARVTQRFTRLDQSRSLPGSGLGLSLVKAVADLHGGQLIFIDNQPGLTVRLCIPIAGPARRPTAAG